MPNLEGIDVSHHQGVIDWDAVQGSGARFAYMKALEGRTAADSKFGFSWTTAKAVGIARGAYHFLRPESDPFLQADRFIEIVGALAAGDLPPAIDVEEAPSQGSDAWLTVPKADRARWVARWIQRVEAHYGVKPVIYTRTSFWDTVFGGAVSAEGTDFAEYGLWIARYNTTVGNLPKPWKDAGVDWTIWQYTDKGTVPGISGHADRNRYRSS